MDPGVPLRVNQMQVLMCDHIHVQPRGANVIDHEGGMVLCQLKSVDRNICKRRATENSIKDNNTLSKMTIQLQST